MIKLSMIRLSIIWLAMIGSLVIVSFIASLFCILMAFAVPGMAEDYPASDNLFHQNINLPPEVVRDVTVSDVLPRGWIYRSESLKISGAGGPISQTVSDPNDGSEEVKVTLSFGEINNSEDQDLQIGFETVVANVPDNRVGAVLPPRRASLRWRDTEGVLHTASAQSEEVSIIEPDLQMERSMEESPNEDAATITISIHHSSRSLAPAFDVDLIETLPQGMSLSPGSAQILSGTAGDLEESGSSRLKLHFDVLDSIWTKDNGVVLSYRATLSGKVQQSSPGPKATLAWTSQPGENPDERAYSLAEDGCQLQQNIPAGLALTTTDDPDPVSPGRILNYTIGYRNSGQDASGVVLQATYDRNTSFSSATPEPDKGTDSLWTIGDLSSGEAGEIRVSVRVMPEAPPGSELVSDAEISAEGMNATASLRTTVKAGAHLAIDGLSSREFLSPGSSMNYTLSFRNEGLQDATNVSVTDILDDHLRFDETAGASPSPSRTWRDKRGINLLWTAEALGAEVLHPGQSGCISVRVELPPAPEHPKIDRLFNLYRIDADQSAGEFKSLETFVVPSLFIRKKAEKKSYSEGDTVNYTIIYGNEQFTEATDTEITDLLPDVEYLGASPEPDYVKGNLLAWRPGRIPPRSSAAIRLSVRIKKRPEVLFWESQSVSGSGFLSSVQTLNTSSPVRVLANHANITAYCLGARERDSCSVSIRLLDALGIELRTARHGSGYSNATQTINYSTREGIRLVELLQCRFSPVILPLSGENLTLESPWADRTRAENFARKESLSLGRLYMDRIEKKGALLLDPNQTACVSEELISGGREEMSYRKRGADFMDVSERYHGRFRIGRHLDSYGSGASYAASASGQGFVASQKRMDTPASAAESYEHGSGSYRSEEIFSTDPLVHKNVEMIYGVCPERTGSFRVNYSSSWCEGTSASDKGMGSLMSSTASSGVRLQKEALMDSSSLSVFEDVQGRATAKAVVSKGSEESLRWEQALAGNYTQDLSLSLYRQPEFLGPHLRLTQTVLWMRNRMLLFRINVTNDGNKTLSPVEITDVLPDGLSFVNSSLRPAISGQNVSWSLPFLPVSQTRTIDLSAKFKDGPTPFLNSVTVRGHYGEQRAEVESSCSQPEPSCILKTASQKAFDLDEPQKSLPATRAECPKSCILEPCLLEGAASNPSFIEEAAEAEADLEALND